MIRSAPLIEMTDASYLPSSAVMQWVKRQTAAPALAQGHTAWVLLTRKAALETITNGKDNLPHMI